MNDLDITWDEGRQEYVCPLCPEGFPASVNTEVQLLLDALELHFNNDHQEVMG